MTDTEQSLADPVVAPPEESAPPHPMEIPPVVAPAPLPSSELSPEFRARAPSLIVGPTLWTFGAFLWAYAVMGELVVQLDFPEVVGWIIVLAAVGRAGFVAVRHMPRDRRRVWRPIVPGLLALLGWLFLVVLVSALLGGGGRSETEAVTLLLWGIGVIAYIFGRRLTRAPKPAQRRFGRATTIAVWVVTGGTTLLAVLSVIGHM